MGKHKKKRTGRTDNTQEKETATMENREQDFDGREMKPKGNCTWINRTRYPYSKPLTDSDRLELAAKLSDSMAKIEKLQYQLKQARDACKDAIDAERGIVSSCARCIRNGAFEPEQIECDVYKDWDTNEMVWVSHDEERTEVHRRPMTPEEMQASLLDIADKEGGDTEKQES